MAYIAVVEDRTLLRRGIRSAVFTDSKQEFDSWYAGKLPKSGMPISEAYSIVAEDVPLHDAGRIALATGIAPYMRSCLLQLANISIILSNDKEYNPKADKRIEKQRRKLLTEAEQLKRLLYSSSI